MTMMVPFTLAAVGDIVLTRPSIPGSGVSEGLATMLAWLRQADVRFANLETVYSERGYPREKLITLRGNPKLVDDLKQMRFDVLSVANNHSVDFGEDSLLETIRLLEDNGIRTVGGGADLDAALAPAVVQAGSTRVGFMAASCLLPVGSAASADRPGLAPIHIRSSFEVDPYLQMEEPGHAPVVHTVPDQADLAAICARIGAARPTVDFLAVSVHLGRGFGEDLAEYEPLVGHALIDAGADVVFGNHVHAIHGIESYAGRAILYSPGNFVAQQPREGQPPEVLAIYDQMSPDAYAAELPVTAKGDYRLVIRPVICEANGLPVPAGGADGERIRERVIRLSAQLNSDARTVDGAVEIDLRSA
jgi:poly-gamma-glutamate capsule biosynthesis protein CapA/YwtB (metallophosphatase superfamily)